MLRAIVFCLSTQKRRLMRLQGNTSVDVQYCEKWRLIQNCNLLGVIRVHLVCGNELQLEEKISCKLYHTSVLTCLLEYFMFVSMLYPLVTNSSLCTFTAAVFSYVIQMQVLKMIRQFIFGNMSFHDKFFIFKWLDLNEPHNYEYMIFFLLATNLWCFNI